MFKNFWKWAQDFMGALVFSTTQASSCGHDLVFGITGTTPTAAVVDGSPCGEVTLALTSTTEAQIAYLSHGDKLNMDIDLVRSFRARIKAGQASLDSATTFAIGLTSDRNDAVESITAFFLFKLSGSNVVLISTDDGTNDLSDKSTGISVSNSSYTDLYADLSNKKDVKFYVNGQPVCQDTTFDISNYTASLQPFVQLQKSSDNNTDSMIIDYIEVEGVRE